VPAGVPPLQLLATCGHLPLNYASAKARQSRCPEDRSAWSLAVNGRLQPFAGLCWVAQALASHLRGAPSLAYVCSTEGRSFRCLVIALL